MRIVQNCFKEKVCHVLNEYPYGGKAVLMFNHGLGDLCLFLPLFESLQKQYPHWDIYIGLNSNRKYLIHPKVIILDPPYGQYEDIDLIFGLHYPEPPRDQRELINWKRGNTPVKNIETITKPYLCNEVEIGLNNFQWKPFRYKVEESERYSNRIGVHFFGYTSTLKKDADLYTAELIWDEIKSMGYEPFEMQMIPELIEDVKTPYFIGNNTLRYSKPDICRMAREIHKCNYFMGVDSGPLYLAGSVLGFDKVIGLEKQRKINKVLPLKINLINIENYKDGSVKNFFVKKAEENVD